MMFRFQKVGNKQFLNFLGLRQAVDERTKEATTPVSQMDVRDLRDCFVVLNGPYVVGGCAITYTGELVGLFSTERGAGQSLVKHVIDRQHCQHLNCIGKFLEEYYTNFGFKTYKVEPNYNPKGEPVYYMSI
jgi:hypothetical protein